MWPQTASFCSGVIGVEPWWCPDLQKWHFVVKVLVRACLTISSPTIDDCKKGISILKQPFGSSRGLANAFCRVDFGWGMNCTLAPTQPILVQTSSQVAQNAPTNRSVGYLQGWIVRSWLGACCFWQAQALLARLGWQTIGVECVFENVQMLFILWNVLDSYGFMWIHPTSPMSHGTSSVSASQASRSITMYTDCLDGCSNDTARLALSFCVHNGWESWPQVAPPCLLWRVTWFEVCPVAWLPRCGVKELPCLSHRGSVNRGAC